MMCNKLVKKALVCLFLILTFCSVTASAVDSRASSRITYATASLTKERDGNICISLCIKANDIMNELGADNVEIQRYNGTKWVSEYTIDLKDMPELMTENESSYEVEIIYSPQYSRNTYRAKVSYYAEDGEGSSRLNVTSNSI